MSQATAEGDDIKDKEREGEWWRGERRWRVLEDKRKSDKEKSGVKPQMEEKQRRKKKKKETAEDRQMAEEKQRK